MLHPLDEKEKLINLIQVIRDVTVQLCCPLENEDYVVQSSEDVSPIKWHLGHTTWFFEVFILLAHIRNYRCFNDKFHELFNSYYLTLNQPFSKKMRGVLSRPTVKEVIAYRKYVEDYLIAYLETLDWIEWKKIKFLIELGLNHEQQHQELILMDIKHNFSVNPLFPEYRATKQDHCVTQVSNAKNKSISGSNEFSYLEGGIVQVGNDACEFAFDNECPRHREIIKSCFISKTLVTNEEYIEFIEDQGYRSSQWWLSEGYDWVIKNQCEAPLYWQKLDNHWYNFTLSGLKKLNLSEPVSHVSYFEADAYARWRGCRLLKESEWEHFVTLNAISAANGNFLESGHYHPQSNDPTKTGYQLFGDLWEWTSSAYAPYAGFKPFAGSLGEYNGKFMCGQMVLRGGSCVTPRTHIRATYRNFYPPDKQWQFAGIRLAKEE